MINLQRNLLKHDSLGAPIPGQSLTSTPGQLPYEKPPITTDPEDALEALVEYIRKPTSIKTIVHLMNAGVSAETIASSFVLGGVSEGMYDVDLAEIIKPPLVMYIVEVAYDNGVKEGNVINEGEINNNLEIPDLIPITYESEKIINLDEEINTDEELEDEEVDEVEDISEEDNSDNEELSDDLDEDLLDKYMKMSYKNLKKKCIEMNLKHSGNKTILAKRIVENL